MVYISSFWFITVQFNTLSVIFCIVHITNTIIIISVLLVDQYFKWTLYKMVFKYLEKNYYWTKCIFGCKLR